MSPSYEPSSTPTEEVIIPTPDGTTAPGTDAPTMDGIIDTPSPVIAQTADPTASPVKGDDDKTLEPTLEPTEVPSMLPSGAPTVDRTTGGTEGPVTVITAEPTTMFPTTWSPTT